MGKHNLGGRCTVDGKNRILSLMNQASAALQAGSWLHACPPGGPAAYFLKCRVDKSKAVTYEGLLLEFADTELSKLHFPSDSMHGQVFLEFPTAWARRRAHAKNEAYVADCQLHLHYSSAHGLAVAAGLHKYQSYTAEGAPCATFEPTTEDNIWQIPGMS